MEPQQQHARPGGDQGALPVEARAVDPAPGPGSFESAPAAVSNEFSSDGRARELRAQGAMGLAEACGAAR